MQQESQSERRLTSVIRVSLLTVVLLVVVIGASIFSGRQGKIPLLGRMAIENVADQVVESDMILQVKAELELNGFTEALMCGWTPKSNWFWNEFSGGLATLQEESAKAHKEFIIVMVDGKTGAQVQSTGLLGAGTVNGNIDIDQELSFEHDAAAGGSVVNNWRGDARLMPRIAVNCPSTFEAKFSEGGVYHACGTSGLHVDHTQKACQWDNSHKTDQMFYLYYKMATRCIIKNEGPTLSTNLDKDLVIHYDFGSTNPLTDKKMGMILKLYGNAKHDAAKKALVLLGGGQDHALTTKNIPWPGGSLNDKTLSAWCRLTSLAAKAGSVISIDQNYVASAEGSQGYSHRNFDAIVWGEYPGGTNYWEPGSEGGVRWADLRNGNHLGRAIQENTPGTLRMLTMVNDKTNDKMIFYVDGVEVMNYKPHAVFPTYGPNSRIIIGWRHTPTGPIHADVYDLKVFNRVLTAAEVLDMHKTTQPV